MNFKEYLTELFDTPTVPNLKWEWDKSVEGWQALFRVEGQTYGIIVSDYWDNTYKDEDLDFPGFTSTQWEFLFKGTWYLEFFLMTKDGNTNYDITGTSAMASSKIFAMVGHAIVDLVKQNPNKFQNLGFGGKEDNRISLYQKLGPLLARKLNKKFYKNRKGDNYLIVSLNFPDPRSSANS